MLIFVQMCKTIDKNLSVFKSSIDSGRTNESIGFYKREACVARKHLKKWGSEDHQKLSTRSWRHQRFWRSFEDHQKLQIIISWKTESHKVVKSCYYHVHHCRRNRSLE